MLKTMNKTSILILCLLFLSGCSMQKKEIISERETSATAETEAASESVIMAEPAPGEDMELDGGIEIQKSSTQIPSRLANEVFEDIKGQISASHEAYGRCENYRMVISNERKKEDKRVWEKLWIYYDLIPVRKPEENPLIIGMKEARETLSDKSQAARADEYIEGWLAELEGNFQQQNEEPDMWYQVLLAWNPEGEDYDLYYDTQVDGHYLQVKFEEYLKQHTEDYEIEKKKGKEYLLEEAEIK